MGIFSKAIEFGGHKGIYALARLLTRKQPKILMYHHFAEKGDAVCTSAANFREQLEYISRHFRPVTVSQLAQEYYEQGEVPANTVALTIDDGYLDFYEIAYPLLKEFNIPATFYITTGFVNGEQWLWTDQLHWMFETLGDCGPAIDLEGFSMPAAADDSRTWVERSYAFNGFLLTLDNGEKWRIIHQVAAEWGLQIPLAAPGMYRACSLEQLREMQSNGIEIGGHTVSHPSLGRVTEAEASCEIGKSYEFLHNKLGAKVRSFCYPNGTPQDYNSAVESLVEKAHYSCAVTAFNDGTGLAQRWAIRRSSGGNELFQFYKAISGVEWLGLKARAWQHNEN